MIKPSITIIGAGLQGATVALALSARGFTVSLVDSRSAPLTGASLRNEGKIHLGFVYALDGDGATRQLMLEGALSFGRLIESWCGEVPWHEWRSEQFRYVVMPDSMLSAERLECSYADISWRLSNLQARAVQQPSYLGSRLSWLWRRSTTLEGAPRNKTWTGAVFDTEEVSIDPRRLCEFIARRIEIDKNISFQGGVTVNSARRRKGGFELELTEQGVSASLISDIVVNCAWEDRVRLDATVGIAPYPPRCSYRIKYQILVRPKDFSTVRAVTMVQGPYGDIVPWNDGTVYLSWYPKGCTYFSALPPQPDYENQREAVQVAEASLEALSGLYPALAGAQIISAQPGIIVAHGHSDVDVMESDLHRRDKIGPRAYDGWWSVDTGKLTTAPYFAEQTAAWIEHEVL